MSPTACEPWQENELGQNASSEALGVPGVFSFHDLVFHFIEINRGVPTRPMLFQILSQDFEIWVQCHKWRRKQEQQQRKLYSVIYSFLQWCLNKTIQWFLLWRPSGKKFFSFKSTFQLYLQSWVPSYPSNKFSFQLNDTVSFCYFLTVIVV